MSNSTVSQLSDKKIKRIFIVSKNSFDNQENNYLVKFNSNNKSDDKPNSREDEKKLAAKSYNYCQDLFSGLLAFLLLNPKKEIFKNTESENDLYFFIRVFLHFRFSPIKFSPNEENYSPKNLKKMESYGNKILSEREDVFDNEEKINKNAFGELFDRLTLTFSILPENIRQACIDYILTNLKNRSEDIENGSKNLGSVIQLENEIFSYHSEEIKKENNQRVNKFKKNFKDAYDALKGKGGIFEGLFKIENFNQNYSVTLTNARGKFENAINSFYEKYEKRFKRQLNKGELKNSNAAENEKKPEKKEPETLLDKIREKIENGLINASDLKKVAFSYQNETDKNKKNKILANFLNRASLDEAENRLEEDCWRRILFHSLAISAVGLKMGGALLLDSAFFFGVAFIFGGFNINFLQGPLSSIVASFSIAALALVIWYGAGLATWYSRVDKIRRTIKSARCFSIPTYKPEAGKKDIHSKFKKAMKFGLLYFVAPIAAVASGLPAFYGALKTVDKLSEAFGSHVSESQTWLISIGSALAIGSAISFFCFYTFKMNKSVDTIFEKWQDEDKSFFLVALAFTLILGMIYFFAIKRALSELSTFAFDHIKLGHHIFSKILSSPVFFGVLFSSLMLINFFTVIDYTARLLKPSEPIIDPESDDKTTLNLTYHGDIGKQENKQLFAKAKYDLEKKPIFKLSIAIIDVVAFSCLGGAMCSNNILGSWNCAHFDEGKLVYNHGALGSKIMMGISSIVVMIIIGVLWRCRKSRGMEKSTAVLASIGFLLLLGAFIVCPSTSSIFFAAIVILANIFVSLAFTHFVNTFLLSTKIEDDQIEREPKKLSSIKLGVFHKPIVEDLDLYIILHANQTIKA